MINMMRLDYTPGTVEWVHGPGDAIHTLAVSNKECNKIYIYDGRGTATPLRVLEKIHMKPVYLIKYNPKYDVAISVDKGGMLGISSFYISLHLLKLIFSRVLDWNQTRLYISQKFNL